MKRTKVYLFSTAFCLSIVVLLSYSFLLKTPTVSTAPEIPNVICAPDPNEPTTAAGSKLKSDMRKLWQEHVVWTRNVIFCIIDDLPGADQATARLLKNQVDIGDAIKPVYGVEAGNALTQLLRTHIVQAADLLKAAKANDDAKFASINKQWQQNGDEIAAFLNKANPNNWKLDEMKKMMTDHLNLTIDEAVARKKKEYDKDVIAYQKVQEEILAMSDMLTDGIIKQYPAKFK